MSQIIRTIVAGAGRRLSGVPRARVASRTGAATPPRPAHRRTAANRWTARHRPIASSRLAPPTPPAIAGLLIVALFALAGPPAAAAQDADAIPLAVGTAHEDLLAPDETRVFTLDVEAGRFAYGEVEQRDVDVAVLVSGPDGDRISTHNTFARGPEPFAFTAERTGRYHIAVRAMGAVSAGSFALEVSRLEPVATTPEGKVDQYMAPWDASDRPGGLIAVVEGGELRFAKAYGMSDLEHGIPNTVDRAFNIGSVSKQFTAFGIALLDARGALSLDDDIRTHIPELPDFGATIRIRNLITHTSGLREYLNLLPIGGRDVRGGDAIQHEEAIRIVQRQRELQFEPGSRHLYNNTGYLLLAEIVERVTGERFGDWMRENVFLPLGMENTMIRQRPGQLVPNRAKGYRPAAGESVVVAEDLHASWGAGGVYTTAADMAKWLENFATARVGGPEVIERIQQPFVLNDGDTIGYAFGLSIGEDNGLRRIGHGGSDSGHNTSLTYYPELDVGIIAFTNFGAANAGGMGRAAARAFLAEHLEPDEPAVAEADRDDADAPDAADAADAAAAARDESPDDSSDDSPTLSPQLLERYVGEYRSDPGMVVSFTREGTTLYTRIQGQPQFPMRALSDTTFQVLVPGVEARVTFHVEARGPAPRATIHQSGQQLPVHRADVWRPTADELAEYVGRYFSREVETFYTLELRDGELTATHVRMGEIPLDATSDRDEFRAPSVGLAQVEFVRDAADRIVGFTVSNGRTAGVLFERCAEECVRTVGGAR